MCSGNLSLWSASAGQVLRQLALLLLLSLSAHWVLAAESDASLADPTRPPGQVTEPSKAAKAKVVYRLDSILYSPSRKVAVINGHSLAEGERLDGLTVLHIEERRVLARIAGQALELTLKPVASVRR